MYRWPFVIALLFGFLAICSCSKEYKFKAKNNAFVATIEGVSFVADSISIDAISANVLPPGGGFAGYIIYAGGSNLSLPKFSVVIPEPEPGTYPVSNLASAPVSARCTFYQIVNGDTILYFGKSGSLTIEEYQKDIEGGIKGSFDFTGVSDQMDTIQVTDGLFEVSLR